MRHQSQVVLYKNKERRQNGSGATPSLCGIIRGRNHRDTDALRFGNRITAPRASGMRRGDQGGKPAPWRFDQSPGCETFRY